MRPSRLRIAVSLLLLVLILGAGRRAAAADGAPDPSFNGNGRATVDVGADAKLRAVAVQADGKVVAVGEARRPTAEDPSNFAVVVVRWNADGTADGSFGPHGNGIVTVEFDLGPPGWRDDGANSVALQPDGKIVVVGRARGASGQFVLAVTRLMPDGDPDFAFGNADGRVTFPEVGSAFRTRVRLRRDGKMVLTPEQYSGNSFLLQLTAEGFRDPGYGFNGESEPWSCGEVGCGAFYDSLELPDGRLLALGTNGDDVVLARFLGEDGGPGELDSFFGNGGVATFTPPGFAGVYLADFALDHQGRVVVLLTDAGGPVGHTALLRVRDDQLDPTFGNGGWADFTFAPPSAPTTGSPVSLFLQSDGKPVVVGTGRLASSWDFLATRRTADGSAVDASFSGGWRAVGFESGLTDMATAVTSSGGRIVAAGLSQTSARWNFAVARLDNALISTDGFESGSTWFWESHHP